MVTKRKGKSKRKSTRRKTKTRKRPKSSGVRETMRKWSKGSLPANPEKGSLHTITRRGRKITFKATGKSGFGKWKITTNKPA